MVIGVPERMWLMWLRPPSAVLEYAAMSGRRDMVVYIRASSAADSITCCGGIGSAGTPLAPVMLSLWAAHTDMAVPT